MLGLATLALGVAAQELVRGARARQAATRQPLARAALGVVRRNRRRYGGYLAHCGVALLLGGIAASSAFQHTRDVTLVPGQSARVGGYEFRYAEPTWSVGDGREGTGALFSIGAVVDVSRGGRVVARLRPRHNIYPATDGEGGAVSRFLDGDPTTEVGLHAGLRRDLWVSISPDTEPLAAQALQGDRQLSGIPGDDGLLTAALLVRGFARGGPAAGFRIIVSPLVSWIWLGVIVAVAGGLVALWPQRAPVLRRVAAPVAAPASERREPAAV
jgi:cytochrome c-type biogenesis protein CcmF